MLKRVSDLKPGEKFIWADNHTRDVMIADQKNRSGIHTLMRQDEPDNIVFHPDGKEHIIQMFAYDDSCYAWVVDDEHDVIACGWDVLCARCGEGYDHHSGMVCTTRKSGIFMPDVPNVDRPLDASDWLAVELGL